MTTTLADRALAPLDGARGTALRLLAGVPPLRNVLVRRSTRIPIGLTAHAVVAFGIAVIAPSLSLVLAPILLGVPHVASDVRHLILRRALPRFWLWAIALFAGALLSLRVLHEARAGSADPIFYEHLLASGWVMAGALAGAAMGGFGKRSALAVAGAAAIAWLSLSHPLVFRLVFAHAHNLIAIAIWLLLFRRSLRLAWIPALLVVGGGALLASGQLLMFTIQHGVLSVLGLHLFAAADWLAPGVPDPQGIGLASSFAFLQSVHYGIWLWAIPQEDARTDRSITFRMSWRSLTRDFTPMGVRAVATIALCAVVAGAMAPVRTQTLVLSLGLFHAWLEVALLAFFLARDGLSAPRHVQAVV